MTSWANKTCMHDLVAYMSVFDRQSYICFTCIFVIINQVFMTKSLEANQHLPSICSLFLKYVTLARTVINVTWWTLCLWSTNTVFLSKIYGFWFNVYEKKKQSEDKNSIFLHTRNNNKQSFFLSGLGCWKICWLIYVSFLKLFFFQIKALYIAYCYQGCLGLINTWRNENNIFLELWHSSNSWTGLLYFITDLWNLFYYMDLLNCWLQLTFFKLLNRIKFLLIFLTAFL